MLNFKLKNDAIDVNSKTPLADFLRTLGIEDVEQFIGLAKKESEIGGEKLLNSIEAVQYLDNYFTQNKKFFLIVDCDTDGYTSSAIFFNYFKSIYPNADIQWMLHEEKQHGIEMDKIPADREVIIVPDAGSNQINELKQLSAQGRKVVVIDHHEVEELLDTDPNVIIVNNQTSPQFKNKSLSGAGVVFKIIQLYDKIYGYNYSSEYYDLAALGIIADCMDSRTLDNNYIIQRGLRNVNNKMFLALVDKQSFSMDGNITKINVAYYIAPLINGTIRMGTMEEKELLFRGFIEPNHTEYYTHEYRGKSTMEDFYHRAARLAYNAKNEQNSVKMKCLEFLKKRIDAEGLDKNQIIAVITREEDEVQIPKTITGLVAMELLNYYKKPSLVLRPVIDETGNLTYAGSGRSNSFEELPSFLEFVRDREESVYAQGHACAFGASIKANEFEHFVEACNEQMADIDFSQSTIYVDAYFKNKINKVVVDDFARGVSIYGNQIPETRIAVEAEISQGDIKVMGAQGTSVKITICNVPCVKFKCPEIITKLQSAAKSKVTLIGKAKPNEFMGTITSQILIDEIEIEPLKNVGGVLF